jgi:hypothetical protein
VLLKQQFNRAGRIYRMEMLSQNTRKEAKAETQASLPSSFPLHALRAYALSPLGWLFLE